VVSSISRMVVEGVMVVVVDCSSSGSSSRISCDGERSCRSGFSCSRSKKWRY